jgi:hypothetical protein
LYYFSSGDIIKIWPLAEENQGKMESGFAISGSSGKVNPEHSTTITKGLLRKMGVSVHLNPDESILYRSTSSRKWFDLAWRIGLELFEIVVLMLFSFTALTSLSKGVLATFLPAGLADVLSRIIFQVLAALLLTAWFAEDTARMFTSELILTNQRVWTKGSPFAWTSARETLLNDIKGMSARRDALFIHLKSTKKTQVHVLTDSKQIAKAFEQFTGKTDPV